MNIQTETTTKSETFKIGNIYNSPAARKDKQK